MSQDQVNVGNNVVGDQQSGVANVVVCRYALKPCSVLKRLDKGLDKGLDQGARGPELTAWSISVAQIE